MQANEYQKAAARTLIDAPGFIVTDREFGYMRAALRMGAEVGEVAERLKKGVLHQHGLAMAPLQQNVKTALDVGAGLLRLINRSHAPSDGMPVSPGPVMLVWAVIGIVGEAGEVASAVLYALANGLDDYRRGVIKKELGDLLWYVAALCSKLGLNLADVMQENIAKLRERYPEGYSAEASKHKPEHRAPAHANNLL